MHPDELGIPDVTSPRPFLQEFGDWKEIAEKMMQDFVTFPFLSVVSGRQGRGTAKGGVSLTWSPGCCSDKSRLLYLLPG